MAEETKTTDGTEDLTCEEMVERWQAAQSEVERIRLQMATARREATLMEQAVLEELAERAGYQPFQCQIVSGCKVGPAHLFYMGNLDIDNPGKLKCAFCNLTFEQVVSEQIPAMQVDDE